MRHQKPWWSHWAGSIFVTDNPTVTPSGSAVADQVRRGVWSSLSSSIFFKKNLHNSSFPFSLESVAASRESGVISRPGSSLFSCGVERQRSAASKIERCLLSLLLARPAGAQTCDLVLETTPHQLPRILTSSLWLSVHSLLLAWESLCWHKVWTPLMHFLWKVHHVFGGPTFTCWPTKHFVIILDVLIWCFAPVWFFLAALLGRPVPVRGERGQAATTAVSLKTLSKLLFRLPVLQTR